MTDATARRLTVASLIRELRGVETDLQGAGSTDDSVHGEMIRLAGDDVRSALGELERAMVVMREQQDLPEPRFGRIGKESKRRVDLAYGIRAILWIVCGFAALGLLDWAAGKLAGMP